MRIIVDAMGGDKGPEVTVKGCVDALNEVDVEIVLVGKEKMIKEQLAKLGYSGDNISIVNADDVITNDDKPVMAIRRKKNSSMVIGLKMIRDKEGDVFISAGNTGALLTGGLLVVGRIKGIERAALAPVYPTKKGVSLLIDAGANADCKPKYLQQFALMDKKDKKEREKKRPQKKKQPKENSNK